MMRQRWSGSITRKAGYLLLSKQEWDLLGQMDPSVAGQAKVEQRFRAKLTKYMQPPEAPDLYGRRVFKDQCTWCLLRSRRHASGMMSSSGSSPNLLTLERSLEHFLVEERVEARDDCSFTLYGW